MTTNVIFAGVGGQGILLAGRVLMEASMKAGLDVKGSEIHGMAQRGGSVECSVRFGEKVHSPLIPLATADFIVCLEMLEAIRKIPCLAKGGTLLVSRIRIDPVPVLTGDMKYPDDIEKWLGDNIEKAIILDGEAAMKEKGASKTLNIVMLGALSAFLEFSENEWEAAITSCVKEKFIETNLNAFKAGRELILFQKK